MASKPNVIAPTVPIPQPGEVHEGLMKDYKEQVEPSLDTWRENKQAMMPQVNIIKATYNMCSAMNRFSPEWIAKHRTVLCNYIQERKDIITVVCESIMNAGIDEASSEFGISGLGVLCSLSDHSRELSKVICAVPGYLLFLYDILKTHSGSTDHLASSIEDLLRNVLIIIHNVAMADSNIPELQELKFTDILRTYLIFSNASIRLVAIVSMADIMREDESHYIEANSSVITFLLRMFDLSLISESRKVNDGYNTIWTVWDLAKGIGSLARNDGNKKLLVAKGCLPLLLTLAKSKDIEEQNEALKSIWTLAFDEDNQVKIIAEPGMVTFVDEQYQTGPSDIKSTCHGILWTMRYKLLESDEHSYIGKRLTNKKHETCRHGETEKSESNTRGHVMISYNWANQELLKRVRERIRAENEEVWMDIYDMAGSTLDAMADAVERADIVLICVSRKYKNSLNCRAEAGYAYKLNKKVIPLIMEQGYEPDGWLGMILGTKLYYDFSGIYPFESKLEGLLKDVHKQMNGVAKPETAAPSNDTVDGPSDDRIVPDRSELVYTSKSKAAPKLGAVKHWNQQQVQDWLKKHDLSGRRVEKLTGKEIAFLQKLQESAPECYYQMLKTDLDLNNLSDMANFQASMDDLHCKKKNPVNNGQNSGSRCTGNKCCVLL